MSEELVAELTVRTYEVDSLGHANNAVYLNYLEYARQQFLEQKGLRFQQFFEWGTLPVVTRVVIDFKSPARAHDRLRITARIVHWGRTSFTMRKLIYNQTTGRECAEADVTLVFVNPEGRPVRVPEEFRRRFGEAER